MEQLFDIEKNYSDLVPLRVQIEETLRGHLLLVFIVSALIKMLQEDLRDTEDTPMNLFLNLRNQKCKVYNTTIITAEPVKKMNAIYKKFDITCPSKFRLNGNRLPEIIELWGLNVQTQVESKKLRATDGK